MPRGKVERTAVAILVFADVQQNQDGSWTSVVRVGSQEIGPYTAATRDEALSAAAEAASVRHQPFSGK